MARNEWMCINTDCGAVLGAVLGGEYLPASDVVGIRTSGPNLVVTCPHCGTTKVWYSSDPIVRAVYQLVDALSSVAAEAMVKQIGQEIHRKRDV